MDAPTNNDSQVAGIKVGDEPPARKLTYREKNLKDSNKPRRILGFMEYLQINNSKLVK